MLQWVSRLLKQERGGSSVLTPDEIPHDEIQVAAKGPDGTLGDVTVVRTKRRLLLTNAAHTEDTLSIPLASVTALESTPGGIRVAYHDAEGDDREIWLGHLPDTGEDDLVWMGDDSWVQSVAAGIMEETGRDVWKEAAPPWYLRGN